MKEGQDYTRGSGNVFADVGLAQPDELLAKAELVRQISAIIRQRRMTQAQAATLLDIDQPKVSALLRGQLSGFSSDRLFRFLNALGRDVQILVRIKPRSRARARVTVSAVARRRAVQALKMASSRRRHLHEISSRSNLKHHGKPSQLDSECDADITSP
ncbi:MAG: putative conserved small protein [Chloroflexi bacterium]|nr:putative conserved small protein [Chloroflexota bacterium]